MPVSPVPQEQLDAAQEHFREQRADAEPRLLNAEAATTAHDDGVLTFRGRCFRVPPVPAAAGLRILVLDRHLARLFRKLKRLMTDEGKSLQDADVQEVGLEIPATYLAMAEAYYACCRPLTLLDRLTWRWRDNPFVHATEQEVQDLAGFFSAARRRSTVRGQSSRRAPSYLRTTWPASGLPSRPRILAGSGPGSPAAGGTTASGAPR